MKPVLCLLYVCNLRYRPTNPASVQKRLCKSEIVSYLKYVSKDLVYYICMYSILRPSSNTVLENVPPSKNNYFC